MTPTRIAGGLLVLAALASVVMFSLRTARETPVAHDVVLGLAGPQVVTEGVAAGVTASDDETDVRVLDASRSAVDDVRAGRLDAALEVDLRGTVDVLDVPRGSSSTWIAALERQVGTVSSAYGRTVRVREVDVRGDYGPRAVPYLRTAAWAVLGVLGAVVVSWWRGPVAATTGRGVARLVGLALAGLVLAVVGGLWMRATGAPAGLDPGPLAIGAASCAVAAWLVLACESLLGLGGITVAAAFLTTSVAPVVSTLEPGLLPSPWREVLPWTPTGASLVLERGALAGAALDPRALVVLASWGLCAVVTLAAARLERPTAAG